MSTEETFAVYCAGEQIDGMDGISYIYVTTPLGKGVTAPGRHGR